MPARRCLLEVRVAGESWLAIHPDPARATDLLLSGAADPDRPVDLVANLEDRVEDRVALAELNVVFVPVSGLSGGGVEPADPQRVIRHWVLSTSFPQAATS